MNIIINDFKKYIFNMVLCFNIVWLINLMCFIFEVFENMNVNKYNNCIYKLIN